MNLILQNRAHGWLGLFLLGGGILYSFPPQQYHFYPLCPFYATTHLLCPGCGGTRAAYHLLHLNFVQAFHLNALVTVAAPFVIAGFFYWYYAAVRYQRAPQFNVSRGVMMGFFILVIGFAVVRNMGLGFAI